MAVFHSPSVALKAAVMNLLSIAAAYGVMALAANGGCFGELVGIENGRTVELNASSRRPCRSAAGGRGATQRTVRAQVKPWTGV